VYDRAYTHLLMENSDAALAGYRKTSEMAPRGFFMTLTAVHTLEAADLGGLDIVRLCVAETSQVNSH
jgi:hypothetical protein